jgi:hypothetical protein
MRCGARSDVRWQASSRQLSAISLRKPEIDVELISKQFP